MSEQDQGRIDITRGEKAVFSIFLENTTFPRSKDLSGFSKFKVCLTTSSGFLIITEVANGEGSIVAPVDSGNYGELEVTVFPVDSETLNDGFGQDIDVEWDVTAGTAPNRKKLKKVLNVETSCLTPA